MAAGLLVIKRNRWFEDERVLAQVGTPRRPSLDLGHEEILLRYRGIDGDSWPEGIGKPEVPLGSNGLVSVSAVHDVRRYFEDVSSRHLCDMLFCQSPPNDHGVPAPEGFSFCGYDVSPGTNDMYCYSVIYNEVIYGLYPELRDYAALLNEHLLLATLADVDRLLDLRERLGQEGADLESRGDRQAMTVIAVHAVKRAPNQ